MHHVAKAAQRLASTLGGIHIAGAHLDPVVVLFVRGVVHGVKYLSKNAAIMSKYLGFTHVSLCVPSGNECHSLFSEGHVRCSSTMCGRGTTSSFSPLRNSTGMDGGSFWISSYDGHTSRHRKVNGASAGRMLGINCGILRNLRGQLRIALVSTHVFSRISARTCSVSLRRPPHIRTELGLCAAADGG